MKVLIIQIMMMVTMMTMVNGHDDDRHGDDCHDDDQHDEADHCKEQEQADAREGEGASQALEPQADL